MMMEFIYLKGGVPQSCSSKTKRIDGKVTEEHPGEPAGLHGLSFHGSPLNCIHIFG